jgi:hypothetical protein
MKTVINTIVHEDWLCSSCQSQNFSKRTSCFKCLALKPKEPEIIPVIKNIKKEFMPTISRE